MVSAAVAAAGPERPEIVLDSENFPTDRYVAEGIAAETGAELVWLEPDPAKGVTPDLVAGALTGRTGVVLLSHVAYKSAWIADLPEITRLAHEAGVPLIVDNTIATPYLIRPFEHGADIGLAFDGDADRCFVIDERGQPVTPSAVTALVAEREIAKEVARGAAAADVKVVANLISSRAVGEVIAENGAQPVRTRVGHSFIKAQMAEHDAVFGGEHSAHYYFRDFWFADTGMLAAMHVLAALGERDAPLSQLVAAYARYEASGEINSTVSDAAAATGRVRTWVASQGEFTEDALDGVTFVHEGAGESDPMWWLNLRASNTEPLLRLNVEAADTATMERVRDAALAAVREGEAQ